MSWLPSLPWWLYALVATIFGFWIATTLEEWGRKGRREFLVERIRQCTPTLHEFRVLAIVVVRKSSGEFSPVVATLNSIVDGAHCPACVNVVVVDTAGDTEDRFRASSAPSRYGLRQDERFSFLQATDRAHWSNEALYAWALESGRSSTGSATTHVMTLREGVVLRQDWDTQFRSLVQQSSRQQQLLLTAPIPCVASDDDVLIPTYTHIDESTDMPVAGRIAAKTRHRVAAYPALAWSGDWSLIPQDVVDSVRPFRTTDVPIPTGNEAVVSSRLFRAGVVPYVPLESPGASFLATDIAPLDESRALSAKFAEALASGTSTASEASETLGREISRLAGELDMDYADWSGLTEPDLARAKLGVIDDPQDRVLKHGLVTRQVL